MLQYSLLHFSTQCDMHNCCKFGSIEIFFGRVLLEGVFNPLNPELNPICYLLALLGAHHFLHVSRIRVKLLTFRRLISYIYRVEQEECARLREGVPYVRVYRYNPKHLYPKLNGLGDNGQ